MTRVAIGGKGSSGESHAEQQLSRVEEIVKAFVVPEPIGVYIQVPFCQTKCTYCNFHTGVASPAVYAPYARRLEL